MTKSGSKVMLEYLKEIARESQVPFTGFGNMTVKFLIQDNELINLKVVDYEANIKPK